MTPDEYDYLRGFLKVRSGLVLTNEKQYLIESRLMPVARKAGLASISVLVAKLKEAPSGVLQTAVVEAMTTNESFFFRDKTPFELFVNTMLPYMLQARARDRRIRIWCAAASTGQEPYTLAMCLKDSEARLSGWRVEMLATDLSNEVLEKARAGLYSQFEVQRGLPINYLLKHFVQTGDLWQISSELRGMVQYRKLNLLENFSALGTFDIIFCRNVLIYFDHETKVDVLNRMRKQVPDDGFLVLGAAETVVGLTDAFKPVPDKRGLYQVGRPGLGGGAPSLPVQAAPLPATGTTGAAGFGGASVAPASTRLGSYGLGPR
jgi:chemotaxis protein methyltransferase CheR